MPIPGAARMVLLPALAACFAVFGCAAALGDETQTSSSADAAVVDPTTDGATTAPTQQELVPEPSQPPGSGYGASTAISGETALVGAPNDQGTGSVTVYTLGGDGTASQQATLTAPSAGEHEFGASVATDGATIVVGSPGSPVKQAVDLYDAATYALLVQILGPDAGGFGSAVAISGDWLAVGAPGGGIVYLYLRSDGVWDVNPYQSLIGIPGSSFGSALAMDGVLLVIGAPDETNPEDVSAGAAHLFTLVSGGEGGTLSWEETGDVLYDPAAVGGEGFGSAVAINGTTIAVGAPNPGEGGGPGRVLIFTDPLGEGAAAPQVINGAAGDSLFGQSLALGDSALAIGYVQADSAGAVALYGLPAIATGDLAPAAGGFSYLGTQTGTGPGDGYGKNLAASGQNLLIGADGHAYLVGTGAGGTPPEPVPGPVTGGGAVPGPGGAAGTAPGGASAGPPASSRAAGVQTGSGSGSGSGSGRGSSPRFPEVRVEPKVVKPGRPHARRHHGAKLGAGAASAQPAAPGRSSFAERVLSPGQVDLSAENLAEGGFLAFILAALLYLPVIIFNKATEKNHETISGWLAGPRERLAALTGALPLTQHPLVLLLSGGVIAAGLFAFVEPGFPSEEGSLQYLIGLTIGFMVVGLVFFATWREVVKRLEPDSQGRWRLYPPYILLAAVLVIVARLAHFLPGVVLGTLAEYEPGKRLSRRTAGLRVLITYTCLLVLGGAAWFAWIPVEHAAAEEGASSLTLILDAALAVTFVTGLESAVFGLIPLKFLDGNDLFAWHKGLWLALWGVGVYWFSVVILHPALSTYNEVSGAGAFWFGVLFSSLMLIAMATWGFFRVREAREARLAGERPAG